MIDDFQHKFKKHFEFFSKSNEKDFRFLFMKICSDLHKRYYHIFQNFNRSFYSFEQNI